MTIAPRVIIKHLWCQEIHFIKNLTVHFVFLFSTIIPSRTMAVEVSPWGFHFLVFVCAKVIHLGHWQRERENLTMSLGVLFLFWWGRGFGKSLLGTRTWTSCVQVRTMG